MRKGNAAGVDARRVISQVRYYVLGTYWYSNCRSESACWHGIREMTRIAIIKVMTQVTRILTQLERGDPSAAEQLLPLVYEELRQLAQVRLAHEKPGQTLQATALVHEAFLRLAGNKRQPTWDSRGHFFAAAAEAMRRILIDNARQKASAKRGGDFNRVEFEEHRLSSAVRDDKLLAIDQALHDFAAIDPQAAELVKLRYFCGFSLTEAAELLGISRTAAYQQWNYARAWLRDAVDGPAEG